MGREKGALYLGIDIGTQSVKVCIFDSVGKIVAKHTETQYMKVPQTGWAEESPEQWWKLILKSIGEIGKHTAVCMAQVKAIGVDAVMHSPVGIGMDGKIVEEEVQLYCDKRTGEMVEELSTQYDSMEYQEITGNPLAPHLMGIKIRWIKKYRPEVYEKTYKFVCGKDYINYKFTNEIATDYSEASGTGIFSQRENTWSDEAIRMLDLDRDKFPQICKSSAVIGNITPAVAKMTGLSTDTKVVCGGGDMLCALYGAGVVQKGYGFDVTGTGSIVGVYNDKPVLNTNITNVRHVMKGWTPYCCIDSSGGSLRWARDVLCKKEVESAEQNGYECLNELAKNVSYGAEGLLFFPYLQGLRQLDLNHAKGVFLGMTPATTTGHLVRAVMEGVAFEHARYYEELDKYENIQMIIHTGGAANSPLWSQIKADIYHKEIVVPMHSECTALGSAMLAMLGAGEYKDELEVTEITVGKYKERYEPNPDTNDRYSQLFEVFKEVNQALKEPFNRLARVRTGGSSEWRK